MTEQQETDVLFPSEWGWQSYEPGFREAADRQAQLMEAEARDIKDPIKNEIAIRWALYEARKEVTW